MANLSTQYMGLSLRNPIIAASSGLTNSINNIIELEKNGAGAIVLKSLFEEQILNESSKMMKEIDSYAFSNSYDYIRNYATQHSVDIYTKLIKEAKQKVSIPIIASINCTSDSEWIAYTKILENSGADAIELNMFALPSNPTKTSTDYEENYLNILTHVKKTIRIPVVVKLSSYFTGMAHFMQKMSWSGADAIALFNRFYMPDIDIQTLELKSASIFSNREEAAHTLRWIAVLSNIVKCDLAATTGIHEGKDAIKQILAGAAVVEIATTLYKDGFAKIPTMLEDIKIWMEQKGFETIADFKGKMSMKQAEHPDVFSRVQFMKYFAGIE